MDTQLSINTKQNIKYSQNKTSLCIKLKEIELCFILAFSNNTQFVLPPYSIERKPKGENLKARKKIGNLKRITT